jgi:alginate O-acetyltransferase complex protein AlgI
MLFNSLGYLLFLPAVFAGYWLLGKSKLSLQNLFLLAASYCFYACWDWRFLFLLIFSTVLDYFTGIKMAETEGHRKCFWFWLSVIVNLGFLGIFKYYNFFADSFAEALSHFGFESHFWTLQVILPVGISFYTFHGLSYVIDIYYNRIKPEKDIVSYSLFVSYFPLLVAGPIERATHLLPQIKKRRQFHYSLAIDGIRQIIWGLFKKVVIADRCAFYADNIFLNYKEMNSLSLTLGAIYYAFQIYGDFSGYSDIALGTSKLFGIDLLRNFNHPYFSRDIAEFWRRWHISLSTWFRDYLYIPLGGSKGGTWMKVRNTFIIFIVSGFWHGANWTFIVWGALNAIYFLPLLLTNNNRIHLDTIANDGRLRPRELMSVLLTFSLTLIAWVFFRSPTVTDAFGYLSRIFAFDFSGGVQKIADQRYCVEMCLLLAIFVWVEWNSRLKEHPFYGSKRNLKLALALVGLVLFGVYSQATNFIYFQF